MHVGAITSVNMLQVKICGCYILCKAEAADGLLSEEDTAPGGETPPDLLTEHLLLKYTVMMLRVLT